MSRKPANSKEKEETTDNKETKEIETPKPEVITKIVEKPFEIENTTKNEREELRKQMDEQDINEHLEKEKQRIGSIVCPKCNKTLGLNPDDYLKKGNKPQIVECPKCETLVRVYVDYRNEPEHSRANITTKDRGYAWNSLVPGEWTDKQTINWIKEEQERLKNNSSSLLNDSDQRLFRVQLLILKKLKIIK